MDRSDGDLSRAECWELLADAGIGRLALSVRALPTILPARYTVDEGSVILGLGRYGLPDSAIDGTVVAFAVDRFDVAPGHGWMVQLQGRARPEPHDAVPADSAPARAGQVVRLTPGTVTGHRFTIRPAVDRR